MTARSPRPTSSTRTSPPGRAPLVLWDVDGTLLSGGPAGRLAFADAIADVLDVEIPEALLPRMAGKTDPQIALEILAALGVTAPAAHLPAIEAALERALSARTAQLRAEGFVHPGIRETLAALDGAGCVQTLVTGNVAPNARTKLAAVGLLPGGPLHIDLGAYGSDHRDRDSLVPVALHRVATAGFDVAPETTWVIGDTPRDLACARAAGVRCLLVATGGYKIDELEQTDADAVLPNVTDSERVVALITAGS